MSDQAKFNPPTLEGLKKLSQADPAAAPVEAAGVELTGSHGHVDRNADWVATRKRLNAGLGIVLQERLASIDREPDSKKIQVPKKITVQSVLDASGTGKTQFYKNHEDFKSEVFEANKKVRDHWKERTGKSKRLGIIELQDEIRKLKRELEREKSRNASEAMTRFIETVAPRDMQKLVLQLNEVVSENEQLKQEVVKLRVSVQAFQDAVLRAAKSID